MAVSLKLHGGSVTANQANIIVKLKDEGITASHSGGVLTITLTDMDEADNGRAFDILNRVRKATNSSLVFVSS